MDLDLLPDANKSDRKKIDSQQIQNLASELHLKEEATRLIYDAEMEKLRKTSRVTNYLSILVIRKIRKLAQSNPL